VRYPVSALNGPAKLRGVNLDLLEIRTALESRTGKFLAECAVVVPRRNLPRVVSTPVLPCASHPAAGGAVVPLLLSQPRATGNWQHHKLIKQWALSVGSQCRPTVCPCLGAASGTRRHDTTRHPCVQPTVKRWPHGSVGNHIGEPREASQERRAKRGEPREAYKYAQYDCCVRTREEAPVVISS